MAIVIVYSWMLAVFATTNDAPSAQGSSHDYITWVLANREWVFSGIGVTVLAAILTVIWRYLFSRPAAAAAAPLQLQLQQPVSQRNEQVVNVHVHTAGASTEPAKPHGLEISLVPNSIGGEPLKILKLLSKDSTGLGMSSGYLTSSLRIPHVKVEYYLDQLIAADAVLPTGYVQKPALYRLSPKGRAYLVESHEV